MSRLSSPVSSTRSVRLANERVVYDVLGLGRPLSAPDLVEATGLSKPTVGLALARLEEVGLVRQSGRRSGATGRSPRIFALEASAGGALAVDVGRHRVRAARVDLAGAVVGRAESDADGRSARALVDQVLRLAARLCPEADRGRVSHTVLGSPGVYDAAADVIRLAPNLPGWDRPAVLRRLRAGLPGTLLVDNDINLAALAELDALESPADPSPERDAPGPSFVLVSVGTGLGMGIVEDGRVLRGARGAAGEISYLPADPSPTAGPTRIEELTGSAAIVRAAQDLGLDLPSAQAVFDAARHGSPVAAQVVEREAERLALAVAAVVAVLDPPLVLLGGGIGRNGDLLLEPLRAHLAARLPLPVPEIRLSRLDVDAPLQGALVQGVLHARRHAFDAARPADAAP
ncbi:putative NBD/HSP70 family sugar kinase [Lapillicoccus jejuensis]|uniref:Putative NBD/HSP70 family sugar kinase n=1 Tax=Lapillicoccus jejuensis TaxID=402171 RepID=A0A542E4X4_9MICO|nr:putative NBD/HSP70 family sugar kinase [Lapillicoccus jejuensis]